MNQLIFGIVLINRHAIRLHCLFAVTGCGADLVATTTKQCFESPGYPRRGTIPDNTDLQCIWNIGKQLPNTAIWLQVERMDLRTKCSESYIDIFSNCK